MFRLPRAAHIDHTGLRVLQELGLVDELLPTMMHDGGLDFVTATDQLLMRVPGDQASILGLPSSMYFYQPDFDSRIRAKVSSLPQVDVRLGYEATSIDAHDTGVVVTAHASDDESIAVEAQWAVGCDGSWSPVREWSGSDSTTSALKRVGLSSISCGRTQRRAIRVRSAVAILRGRPIPSPCRRSGIVSEFMLMPDEVGEDMIGPDSVYKLIAPWMRRSNVEIERAAIYTFHGLIAHEWRRGRVLIAGDAAHQMPPFLGQGMCSGLRDAANLAWKLEFAVRRGSPSALLDTYGGERAPHVRTIIEAAIAFGDVICTIDHDVAAVRDQETLSGGASAFRRLGFSLPSLPAGPAVLEGGGELFVQTTLPNGMRSDDAIGNRFAVIARREDDLVDLRSTWETQLGAFVTTIEELGGEVPEFSRWLGERSAEVVVVRPDRYVLGVGVDLTSITERIAPLLGVTSDLSAVGAVPLDG